MTPTNEQVEQALNHADSFTADDPEIILAAEVRRLREAHASTESTHPADMSKNGGGIDMARIAELEAAIEAQQKLRWQVEEAAAALRTRAETAEARVSELETALFGPDVEMEKLNATLAAVIRAGDELHILARAWAIYHGDAYCQGGTHPSHLATLDEWDLAKAGAQEDELPSYRDAAPGTFGPSEWLDLLMACQDGRATCMRVMEIIERELAELRKDKQSLGDLVAELRAEVERCTEGPSPITLRKLIVKYDRTISGEVSMPAIDAAVAGGRAK